MKRSARDRRAAGLCLTLWLASIGFLALGGWALRNWAGPFGPAAAIRPEASHFRDPLRQAQEIFGFLALLYWLLAYGLGAARIRRRTQSGMVASALLVAALIFALLFSWLQAAPGLFEAGIDSCTLAHHRAHPADPCLDCAIHSCETLAYLRLVYAGWAIVLPLMAASLVFRWRARERARG